MHKSMKMALAGAAITTLALAGCSGTGASADPTAPADSAAAGGEDLTVEGEVIATADVYAAAQ